MYVKELPTEFALLNPTRNARRTMLEAMLYEEHLCRG